MANPTDEIQEDDEFEYDYTFDAMINFPLPLKIYFNSLNDTYEWEMLIEEEDFVQGLQKFIHENVIPLYKARIMNDQSTTVELPQSVN